MVLVYTHMLFFHCQNVAFFMLIFHAKFTLLTYSYDTFSFETSFICSLFITACRSAGAALKLFLHDNAPDMASISTGCKGLVSSKARTVVELCFNTNQTQKRIEVAAAAVLSSGSKSQEQGTRLVSWAPFSCLHLCCPWRRKASSTVHSSSQPRRICWWLPSQPSSS
ncbi:hypothetical protein PVAP13_9KG419275 [Panicum virgatum]|uniref:Uncharacterized protein n=1 Tax=Panicum virgatum TaxID=38727 RepID=A0A8T0N7V0_PANVG|nr:hypothetical protein PVAP13_9KG419275 [Panicum virgatum]